MERSITTLSHGEGLRFSLTTRSALRLAGVLWLALLVAAIATQPLLPVDETRYVAVAWEMWRRGDFLVPHLDGVPYSDKPPLLFWLVHAGWAVAGVGELWARLVSPLFGLATLALTARMARELWPGRDAVATMAPLIVVGSLLWAVFTDLVLFDMLLGAFVLAALLGVLEASRRPGARGWLLTGAAIGGGILAKGPVMLLHVLPVALLAPWWARPLPAPARRWYGGVLLALLLGALIALAWAVPAALAGGASYARAIFLGQTANRMVHSFAHRRPVWWYLPLLPAMLFPWLLWPPVWRALAALRRAPADPGVRFCLAWLLPVAGAFSLISGKQMHYLLPLFPAFALLAARALAGAAPVVRRRDAALPALVLILIGAVLLLAPAIVPRLVPHASLPEWSVRVSPAAGLITLAAAAALLVRPAAAPPAAVAMLAGATALLVIAVNVGAMRAAASSYDARPVGAFLRGLEQRGYAIAHVGKYSGQYDFAGRLERPLAVIAAPAARGWLAAHPRGAVVAETAAPPRAAAEPHDAIAFVHRYGRGFVVVTVAP